MDSPPQIPPLVRVRLSVRLRVGDNLLEGGGGQFSKGQFSACPVGDMCIVIRLVLKYQVFFWDFVIFAR